MTNKKITIKDVANDSGVSITTVSQILNGNGARFSGKTVEKVLAAKERLNYQPDYFAQRMVMKKSKTIGVIVPDITNPFFAQLIRGIESVLYKENFILMLCNADQDVTREHEYLTELIRRSVDGFVIASSEISNQTINETLRAKKIPFIVLDQKKAEGFSDAVLTDDYRGGQLAAKHLQEQRHEQVIVVMPPHAPVNIQQRLKGFCSVYTEKVQLIETELSKTGGYQAVPEILKTESTGIFAINDEIAFGLYRGLAEAGKKIPEDYSIIGYDNVDMCEYVSPPLTTIAQPVFQLGKTTATLLLERIHQPAKDWEEQTLPVQLIERFSTAPLK